MRNALLTIVCLLFLTLNEAKNYRDLGVFNTTGPTVANLAWIPNWSKDSEYPAAIVFASAANRLLHPGRPVPDSAIYVIPEIASKLFDSVDELTYELVSEEYAWANELRFIEKNMVGFNLSFPALLGVNGRFPTAPRFVIPSVPGGLFLLNTTTLPAQSYKLSPPETCEYYYQTFKLLDLNGDGLLDVLTVRVRDDVCSPLKVFPPFFLKAELVALLQPQDPLASYWELRVLYNFDNVANRAAIGYFEFLDIDEEIYGRNNHTTAELLTSEFSGGGSFIYYIDGPEDWLSTNKTVKRTVIEDKLGGMYTIRVLDINRDGKKDILATTHTVVSSNGVYAYNVLGNYRNVETLSTQRYALASNFTVFGRPATPTSYRTGPFEILPEKNDRKPRIVVGTDGGGEFVLLSPKNQNKNSWEYESTTLAQFGCDIIAPIVYDADEDGKPEFSAPCLGGDAIYTFSEK
jgi:hypothetical protein